MESNNKLLLLFKNYFGIGINVKNCRLIQVITGMKVNFTGETKNYRCYKTDLDIYEFSSAMLGQLVEKEIIVYKMHDHFYFQVPKRGKERC